MNTKRIRFSGSGLILPLLLCFLLSIAEKALFTQIIASDLESIRLLEENDESRLGLWLPFDGAFRFKRVEREIKDRFELLYQLSMESYQEFSVNECTLLNDVMIGAEGENVIDSNYVWSLEELIAQLEIKRNRTWSSNTKTWKNEFAKGAAILWKRDKINIIHASGHLKQLHRMILQILGKENLWRQHIREGNEILYPIRIQPWLEGFSWFEALQNVSLVFPEKIPEVITNFSNASYLPTHKEIARVIPWLDPCVDTPRPSLSTLINIQPLVDFVTQETSTQIHSQMIPWITPLSWIYVYSNPLGRKCEIWTQEYIQELAIYLLHRLKIYQRTEKLKSWTILEVGAGDGRLTKFLSDAFHRVCQPHFTLEFCEFIENQISFVATDAVIAENAVFPVEKIDFVESVDKYKPLVVLTSWMPQGIDFTWKFRQSRLVMEYILIGETDWGVCGHLWETWGIKETNDGMEKSEAPYKRDGFSRYDLERLSLLQIARSDGPHIRFHGSTISFRRLV